ncbi:MAG: DUF362 domain-containing protein [Planctomycetota bacterium]|jgi:uncharacterized Fe-S center protein
MPSKVHFAKAGKKGGMPGGALGKLFEAAGLGGCFSEGDFVALKMHFGEPGNRNVWQPAQVREIVEKVRTAGAKPFLTDANVLYRSPRHNAVEHLITAHNNGFSYESCGAPIVIADGLRGDNCVEMEIPGGKHNRTARIAAEVARADAVISLTHVTGHIGFGLGAAVKNLGMGSGSIAGKQMMHENFRPAPNAGKCIACGACAKHCPVDAVTVPEGGTADVDDAKCVGCGECVAHCPTGAIPVQWGDTEGLQERTAEFCAAIMNGRGERFGFMSLMTGITPMCDCMVKRGDPVCADIGALAGRDLVAVEAATADLLEERGGMKGLREACTGCRFGLGTEVAEKLGLGSRDYELVEV